jgi:hypothetical protein
VSESDSFIDEVAEEVRRDRLFALMRKYGWIGIAAVVLIVGGAAWNEWQKARAQAAAETFGDAVLAAVADPEARDRAAALAAVEAGGSAGRAGVLGFLTAAEAEGAGDRAAALAALRAVAENPETTETYRQLAQIKIVTLAAGTMDPAERDRTLEGLAAPGAPFRTLAMEQQALALLADGQTDAAAALLGQIAEDAETTPALKSRAGQVLVAIGRAPATE